MLSEETKKQIGEIEETLEAILERENFAKDWQNAYSVSDEFMNKVYAALGGDVKNGGSASVDPAAYRELRIAAPETELAELFREKKEDAEAVKYAVLRAMAYLLDFPHSHTDRFEDINEARILYPTYLKSLYDKIDEALKEEKAGEEEKAVELGKEKTAEIKLTEKEKLAEMPKPPETTPLLDNIIRLPHHYVHIPFAEGRKNDPSAIDRISTMMRREELKIDDLPTFKKNYMPYVISAGAAIAAIGALIYAVMNK